MVFTGSFGDPPLRPFTGISIHEQGTGPVAPSDGWVSFPLTALFCLSSLPFLARLFISHNDCESGIRTCVCKRGESRRQTLKQGTSTTETTARNSGERKSKRPGNEYSMFASSFHSNFFFPSLSLLILSLLLHHSVMHLMNGLAEWTGKSEVTHRASWGLVRGQGSKIEERAE